MNNQKIKFKDQMWLPNSIIGQYNRDAYGNIQAYHIIRNYIVSQQSASIKLGQIPDQQQGVMILSPMDMIEVKNYDELEENPNAYYVFDNKIYFNHAMSGKSVKVDYYGIGNNLISIDSVYTQVDEYGNIIQTLGDIFEIGDLITNALSTMGDVVTIIHNLNDTVAESESILKVISNSIMEMKESINVAETLNSVLNSTINTGNESNKKLESTIQNGENINEQLNDINEIANGTINSCREENKSLTTKIEIADNMANTLTDLIKNTEVANEKAEVTLSKLNDVDFVQKNAYLSKTELISGKSAKNNFDIIYEKSIKNGLQLTTNNRFIVLHNNSFVEGNEKTFEAKITMKPYELIKLIPNLKDEISLINKPNSFLFKFVHTASGYKLATDIYNQRTNAWVSNLEAATPFNIKLIEKLNIERYGCSQGISTDGNFLYTSNNRLDVNNFHIHKRRLDGTFMKGLNLPNPFNHPCGIKAVGELLFVLANKFNGSSIDGVEHKVYVINTNSFSIIDEFDLNYELTGNGGYSGISYNNGLFYLSDWQIENNTNITIFNSNFEKIETFQINCQKVQGLEVTKEKIIVASNQNNKFLFFDIISKNQLEDYPFKVSVEGGDVALTPDGCLLHGDVNTINKYRIPCKWYNTLENVDYHLKTTISTSNGKMKIDFYIDNCLQVTTTVDGSINNLESYGLIFNGNFAGHNRGVFNLKYMGIKNNLLETNLDDYWNYNNLWLDTKNLKDMCGNKISTEGTLINY